MEKLTKTQKDNIILASFYGDIKKTDQTDGVCFNVPGIEVLNCGLESEMPILNVGNCCIDTELKFHSDWKWLMKLLAKIKEVWEKEFVGEKIIGNDIANSYITIFTSLTNLDQEKTWEGCVEFVKWYNKK